MERFGFDIEVFCNFFSVIFINTNNESEKHTFVIADEQNDIKSLYHFLDREMILIGFNNILYDGTILHLITESFSNNPNIKPQELNPEIYDLSNTLINSNRMMFDTKIRNHQRPDNIKYKHIDLMKLMAFDKLGVSLKQISINLLWHKVQDLPLPYDHKVQPSEYPKVLEYNENDVLITIKLLKALSSQIELREKLSEEYEVDLMSASDSKMADVILEHIYCKSVGITPRELRNLRTERDSICIKDCIGKNIKFQTNTLKRIKREIEEKIVHKEDNFKYSKTVKFANVVYELGVGGLHSVDKPAIFNSSENVRIIDQDAQSYYPSIMINNKLYPEHLDPKFVNILKRITKERLTAKKNGNKIKADSLKITVNSIFGKLGSDVYWLYDPKQLLSVTVSGQLYLLMLIEALVLEGIEVISANTDGVVACIPKHLEDKHKEVCEWWQKKTDFTLEYTEYSAYYRSDVNNYIVVKTDGKTKEKGRYLKNIELKRAYRHPIIPLTLYNYFVNKISVIDTLKQSTNILDFCISQKTGGDFILEFHKDDNVIQLQKNNRFFISTSGGSLIKRRMTNGSEIGLYVGKLTTILNDYDETIPINNYDIDYAFYEEEAQKYISDIENNQELEPFVFEDEPENYVDPNYIREQERECIVSILKGIKGIPNKLIDNLTHLNKHFQDNDFLNLLVYCEENSLISSKFKELIKINYFKDFGCAKKQLWFFDEFTGGKFRYKKTLSEKSKIKRLEELRTSFVFTDIENFTIKESIQNEINVANEIRTKFDVNKRYAYVKKIDTKYTPKLELQSLSTGTNQVVKISKKTFNQHPVQVGDILLCKSFIKKNAMRKNTEGKWEETDKIDWYLDVFYVTEEDHEFIK